MKKQILIIILLLIAVIKIPAEVKPNFFIVMKSSDDTDGLRAKAILFALEAGITQRLRKDYTCAEYLTSESVANSLKLERTRELLGSGDPNILQKIGEALGCDYLIVLEAKIWKGSTSISAFCLDNRKVQALSRAFGTAPYGDAAIDAVGKVTNQLFNGLKTIEICPFKGTIDITIISEKDTTEVETYDVYCNNSDQTYRKEEYTNIHTASTWNLEKKNLHWTDGDMSFHEEEYYTLTEENGCYKCKSGREGGRTLKIKRSYTVDGRGVSHESVRNGKKQLDTRSELIFYEDSTYSLHVQGTSKPSNANEKNVISAEGTCDNISPQNKTIKKEVAVPLNLILGPFKGCALNKILKHKNTIKTVDPDTHEKETISYEFNLEKD